MGRVLHRGRDAQRDDGAAREREQPHEREAPPGHARPLREPRGEDEPLQVHTRGDRVKVVGEALGLGDDAQERRNGQERDGEVRRGISPRSTSASRTTAPENAKTDCCASHGREKISAGARGQMKRYIAGTSTSWMRSVRADVTVGQQERELGERTEHAADGEGAQSLAPAAGQVAVEAEREELHDREERDTSACRTTG